MIEKVDQWWGEFSIKEGATAQWQIGPTQIAVQRLAREWLMAHEQIETSENKQAWRFAYCDLDLSKSEDTDVSRFVWQDAPEIMTILPALADRSVVSRPFTPFTVPADENATIYISTPLWFVLAAGSPMRTLFEIPIQRPSDTWFGPSTREGETCYASRTHGRLNLENLNIDHYRAITQVHIHNSAPGPLLVERLNIPVPYLSLYHTKEGYIWTEAVTVVQTRGTSLAQFDIEKELPLLIRGAELIAGPRHKSQKGMLISAFSALKVQGFD